VPGARLTFGEKAKVKRKKAKVKSKKAKVRCATFYFYLFPFYFARSAAGETPALPALLLHNSAALFDCHNLIGRDVFDDVGLTVGPAYLYGIGLKACAHSEVQAQVVV
jgi:hypothetical protein